MNQSFYTTGQAAKELGVSSYRIRRLCEAGLIADAEFDARRWLIPVSTVKRLTSEGVPPTPRTVDAEATELPRKNGATARSQNRHALLAEPSDDTVRAAEEALISENQLAVSKNRLEQLKVKKQATEIGDYFEDREQRRAARETAERQRYADEQAEQVRQREAALKEERQKQFYSKWLEYALDQKPYDAPQDLLLDMRGEVVSALQNLDPDLPDHVIECLMNAAVQRALKPWRRNKEIAEAIDSVRIWSLPYAFERNPPNVLRFQEAATAAISRLPDTATPEDMKTAAKEAARSLIVEFEHNQNIERMIASPIPDATEEEQDEAQEILERTLRELSPVTPDRQIERSRNKALEPLQARIRQRRAQEQQRDEEQRQEERRRAAARQDEAMRTTILSTVEWSLPWGMSDSDKKRARTELTEALATLPAGTPKCDLEKARDHVVERYKAKERLIEDGVREVHSYAEKMLKRYYGFERDTVWTIEQRVRSKVEEALHEELDGMEGPQFVIERVRKLMKDLEGCED